MKIIITIGTYLPKPAFSHRILHAILLRANLKTSVTVTRTYEDSSEPPVVVINSKFQVLFIWLDANINKVCSHRTFEPNFVSKKGKKLISYIKILLKKIKLMFIFR